MAVITPDDKEKKRRQATPLEIEMGDGGGARIQIDPESGVVRLVRPDGQDLILGQSLVSYQPPPFSLDTGEIRRVQQTGQIPPATLTREERAQAAQEGSRPPRTPLEALGLGVAVGTKTLWEGAKALEGWLAGEIAAGLAHLNGRPELADQVREIARRKFVEPDPEFVPRPTVQGPEITPDDNIETALAKIKNFALQRPADFIDWAFFNLGTSIPVTALSVASMGAGAALGSVGLGALGAAAFTTASSAGEIAEGKGGRLETKDIPIVLGHAALEYIGDLVTAGAVGVAEDVGKKLFVKRFVTQYARRNPGATIGELARVGRWVSRRLERSAFGSVLQRASAALSPFAEAGTEYLQSGLESLASEGEFRPSLESAIAGFITGGVFGAAGTAVERVAGRGPAEQAEQVVQQGQPQPQQPGGPEAEAAAASAMFQQSLQTLLRDIQAAQAEAATQYILREDPAAEFAPRVPSYLEHFNSERSRPLEHLTVEAPAPREVDIVDTPAGVARLEFGQDTAPLVVPPEELERLPEERRREVETTIELTPKHLVQFDLEETLVQHQVRLLKETEEVTPDNILPKIEDSEANQILARWRETGVVSLREALQHPKLLRHVAEGSPFKEEFTLQKHFDLLNELAAKAIAGARGRFWYEASAAAVANMFGLPVRFDPAVERFLAKRNLTRGVQRRQQPEEPAPELAELSELTSDELIQRIQTLLPKDLETRRTLALKFLRAVAVLSGAQGLATNWNQAVQALEQYLNGQPITAGGDRVKNRRLNEIFYEDKPWSGEKTNSFFLNLSALLGLRQGQEEVTVDRWIVRALGYRHKEREAPTVTEYRYSRSVIQSVADALGWTPMQVQAAIWEQERAQSGKLSDVVTGRVRTPAAVSELRVPLESLDFADMARRYSGQVSVEALGGVKDWLQNAPEEIRIRATERAGEILLDILRDANLFPVEDVSVLGGWWVDSEGVLHHNPSLQVRVALPILGGTSRAEHIDTLRNFIAERRAQFGEQAGLFENGEDLALSVGLEAARRNKLVRGRIDRSNIIGRLGADPGYGLWTPAGLPEELANADIEERLAWWEQNGEAKGAEDALRWLVWRRVRFEDPELEAYRRQVIGAADLGAAMLDLPDGLSQEKWRTFWNEVNRQVLDELERFAESESNSHPHFLAGVSALLSGAQVALIPDSVLERIDLVGHLINLVFDQQAIGWSAGFRASAAKHGNQILIETRQRQPLSREQFERLKDLLAEYGLNPSDYAVITTPEGARVLLFNLPEDPEARGKLLQDLARTIARKTNEELTAEVHNGTSGLVERTTEDQDAYQAWVLQRLGVFFGRERREAIDYPDALEPAGGVLRAGDYYARTRQRWINILLSPEFAQYISPEDRQQLIAERENLGYQRSSRGLEPGGGRLADAGARYADGRTGRYAGEDADLRGRGGRPRGASRLEEPVRASGDGGRVEAALPVAVPGAGLYGEGEALGGPSGPAGQIREAAGEIQARVVEAAQPELEFDIETRRELFLDLFDTFRASIEPIYKDGTEGVVWATLFELQQPDGFRLYGRKVESLDDIARILMLYRNPNVEIFRAIFITEDGEVVDEAAVSAFAPHFTSIAGHGWANKAVDWYTNQIQRLSARTGKRIFVIFSHNHPSGRAVPSHADKATTATVASQLYERLGYNPVKHAFVTDGGVVSYTTLPEDYHIEIYGLSRWEMKQVPGWQRLWSYEPKGTVDPDSQVMLAREMLMRAGARISPGESQVFLMAFSSSWELRAILRLNVEAIKKNPRRYFEAVAIKHGAPMLIAIVPTESDENLRALRRWQEAGFLSQAISLEWLQNSLYEDRVNAFSTAYPLAMQEAKSYQLYEEETPYNPEKEKPNEEYIQLHRLVNPDAPSELASPATDPMVRSGAQMVDQVMRLEYSWPSPETFDEWIEQAREKLLDPGYRGRIMRGDIRGPEDVMAAKLLIDEIGQDAIAQAYEGNDSGLDRLVRLVIGYRMARTEIARALAAGRDPVRGPAERFREMVFGAIYNPTPEELQALQNARTIEEREAVLLKIKERARQLMNKLLNEGVRLDKVNWNDPAEVAGLVRQIQHARGSFSDAIYEYWINAILSHTATHVVNFVSNAIQFVNRELVERTIQAGLNLVFKDPDLPTFGEFVPMFKAFLKRALPTAIMRMRLAFRTEFGILDEEVGGKTQIKWVEEGHRFAIPGKVGRIIRIPSRLLLAADELWKNLVYHTEMAALAYRIARAEGLSGEALERRMDELMADPQGPVSQAAYARARMVVFQEELPPAIQRLAGLRKESRLLAYLLPFVATPTNIFRQALRYTPVGTIMLIRNFATGRFKSRQEWVQLLSEQVIGWLAFWTIALLSGDADDEDKPIAITGSRGVLRGERDLSYRVAPPTSIKIGGRWYSYSRLDPLATVLQVWVDTVDIIRTATERGQVEEALRRIPEIAAGLVYDKTMLAALNDLVYIASRPGEGMARMLSRYATSFIPAIVRGATRASDPYLRESRPFGQGVFWVKDLTKKSFARALAPWTLEPRIDIWGNPIRVRMADRPLTDFLYRMLTPVSAFEVGQPHPVDLMILRWNQEHPNDQYWPVPPPRTFTLYGVDFYMPDSIYTEYLKLSGSIAAAELRAAFPTVPEKVTREHMEYIQQVFRDARSIARDFIIAKYEPEIYQYPRDPELARQAGFVTVE